MRDTVTRFSGSIMSDENCATYSEICGDLGSFLISVKDLSEGKTARPTQIDVSLLVEELRDCLNAAIGLLYKVDSERK